MGGVHGTSSSMRPRYSPTLLHLTNRADDPGCSEGGCPCFLHAITKSAAYGIIASHCTPLD
jgi:hypothetical protein